MIIKGNCILDSITAQTSQLNQDQITAVNRLAKHFKSPMIRRTLYNKLTNKK